jgi:hypothetical protein
MSPRKPDEPKGRDAKSANERSPMCPICKTKHWGREPHNFKGAKKR